MTKQLQPQAKPQASVGLQRHDYHPDTPPATQAEVAQTTAYRLALDSDDPIFHSYLYDWFVSNNRTDLLLEVRQLSELIRGLNFVYADSHAFHRGVSASRTSKLAKV